MLVQQKSRQIGVPFDTLKTGECFIYPEAIGSLTAYVFMKKNHVHNGNYHEAIAINDGTSVNVHGNKLVVPFKFRIVEE